MGIAFSRIFPRYFTLQTGRVTCHCGGLSLYNVPNYFYCNLGMRFNVSGGNGQEGKILGERKLGASFMGLPAPYMLQLGPVQKCLHKEWPPSFSRSFLLCQSGIEGPASFRFSGSVFPGQNASTRLSRTQAAASELLNSFLLYPALAFSTCPSL